MKFYIASKLENAARVRHLAKELKSWGWEHTYDWTTHGAVLGDEKALRDVAKKELHGVAQADLFIALLPGGRGTHTELGIALMSGCEIVLHSEEPAPFDVNNPETCSFYWLSGVERVCCPWEELAGWLKQRFGAKVRSCGENITERILTGGGRHVKKIKGYLELCYDIELIQAEIRVLRKQKREIEFQISKLSGAPASYPSVRYNLVKVDRKYSAPPQLEALWTKLEEINKDIEAKTKDLNNLEYRKKNIDEIIGKMDRPKNRVAILREIKGRTLAEIADEMGYSESHIKRLSAEITQEIYQGK